ncbi:MAG: hypothetical protein JWN15_3502 [Firmicutes bacterium]|nr:hypothetical protein [Bacillota bacterium]
MKAQLAYLMAVMRSERGGIDSYVTTAVMIFLAVAAAFVLIGMNTQLSTWVTGLVNSLTGKPNPL